MVVVADIEIEDSFLSELRQLPFEEQDEFRVKYTKESILPRIKEKTDNKQVIRAMLKEIRQYISQYLNREGTSEPAQLENKLKRVLDMRITYGGTRVDAQYLNKQNFSDSSQLKIGNPDESVLELNNAQFIDSLNLSERGESNIRAIMSKLKNIFTETEVFQLNVDARLKMFLGALDISKKENRESVYEYFEKLNESALDKFIEDGKKFFEAVKSMPNPFEEEGSEKKHQELLEDFETLSELLNKTQLDYIAEFKTIEQNVIPPNLRWYTQIAKLASLKRLVDLRPPEEGGSTLDDPPEEYSEGMDEDENWKENAIVDAIESSRSIDSQWEASSTLELREEDSSQRELDAVISQAEEDLQNLDPLLALEYSRNDRLLAITEDGDEALYNLLTGAREALESDEIVLDIDFDTDIDDWIEEFSDTTVIDDRDTFHLPISVLEDGDMANLYDERDIRGAQLENIENINFFFEELAKLVSDELPQFLNFYRRGGKASAGTDMRETFRGFRGELATSVKESEYARQKGRDAPLIGLSEGVKAALVQMLESANEYFFEPAFTGRMVVVVPDFVSNVGGRVMQMQGAKLGLETVMSGAYSVMANARVEDLTGDMLSPISDFLEMAFLKSISIDGQLIDAGEKAAKALTQIFENKERNYDYVAALISYLMIQTGDFSLKDNSLDGQTIENRTESFYEDYQKGKAYPIFALPYWLDANTGAFTARSRDKKSKEEYDRLLRIFQEVQQDLPILLRKMLKAHDIVREQLDKPIVYGFMPFNEIGFNTIIKKMQMEENLDLSSFEVENIVKEIDSHQNISKEFGISAEQVYLIKAHFR
tara:strand:- start:1508 stop:3985 length:2478 start_codon:yes stop_codon:yes gene_type:complete